MHRKTKTHLYLPGRTILFLILNKGQRPEVEEHALKTCQRFYYARLHACSSYDHKESTLVWNWHKKEIKSMDHEIMEKGSRSMKRCLKDA